MAILSINRDYGVNPCIVRMASDDDLAAIMAPNYLVAQEANIQRVNSGDFSWEPSDAVLCYYLDDEDNGAWAFLGVSADFTSLNPIPSVSGLFNVNVVLNQAAVQGAYAAPALLVPAPGAGNAIILNSARVITEVGTAFADGGVAIVQYDDTVHGAGVNALSATIPAAEITAATSQLYSVAGPTAALTGLSNLGLYFSNATGAFTGGANSTVTLVLQYQVVPAVV